MPKYNIENFPPYIVNTNTNIIMKMTEGVLKRETITRLIYLKVRANGELDFHKTTPRHRIKSISSKVLFVSAKLIIKQYTNKHFSIWIKLRKL